MQIKKIVDKCFYYNTWSIGIRKINENSLCPTISSKAAYNVFHLNDYMYYADPFLIEDGDETYIFAESMNRYRGIGSISVAAVKRGGGYYWKI